MYFRVSVNNGELDIDYRYLIDGIQISETEAYVALRPGYEVRETWQEITAEEFNQVRPIAPAPPAADLTMEGIKNNQLVIMEALADIYVTMLGGGN